MRLRGSDNLRFECLNSRRWSRTLIIAVMLCTGLLAMSPSGATGGDPGAIPAWLDDAITEWNKVNPASPIQFLSIKDSYVWYTIPAAPEFGSKDIRDRVYGIAYKNGYANKADEEMVTTARPPAPTGPAKTMKCFTRSFLRDAHRGSTTSVERMLTVLVCEDRASWSLGFRILQ